MNWAKINGVVESIEEHYRLNDKEYTLYRIKTLRLSGKADFIPVIISRGIVQGEWPKVGERVQIVGQLRTYYYLTKDIQEQCMKVFALFMKADQDNQEDMNVVFVTGKITYVTGVKMSSIGKVFCNVKLQNENYIGKRPDIMCVAWGEQAMELERATEFEKRIRLRGRLQSRIYKRYHHHEVIEEKEKCEISIFKMKLYEET